MLDLSVVIPTFDRAATIDQCLRHLADQHLPAERFEVIVADDASTDDTEDTVRRWESDDRIQVRYLRCPKGFAGGARNRGAALARGARILFLGDDILATPALLEKHLRAADRWGSDAVVIGEVRYADDPPPSTFMRWLEDQGVHHDFPRLRAQAESVLPGRYFYACNASLPAAALQAVGGFDERIQRAWEDTELGVRLERAGYRLHFLPGVTGLHVHPTDLRRYTRFLRAGRADIGRAVESLRDLGEDFPAPVPHPVLDRLVGDTVIDRVVDLVSRTEGALPRRAREAMWRRILRYERRRGLLAADDGGQGLER